MKITLRPTLAIACLALAAYSCQAAMAPTAAPAPHPTCKAEAFSRAVPDSPMDRALEWAIQIAENPVHGYSQGAENATSSHPYTGSREGPDYDCSSLVYHALDHAGFGIIAAWKNNPKCWSRYNGTQETGDADTIWPDLQAIGGFAKYRWDEVKDDLRRGDILCDPEHHVAFYIGNGKTVEARGVNNPKGGDWRTGDQGGEIDFYSPYGRGWTEVYRYVGAGGK